MIALNTHSISSSLQIIGAHSSSILESFCFALFYFLKYVLSTRTLHPTCWSLCAGYKTCSLATLFLILISISWQRKGKGLSRQTHRMAPALHCKESAFLQSHESHESAQDPAERCAEPRCWDVQNWGAFNIGRQVGLGSPPLSWAPRAMLQQCLVR